VATTWLSRPRPEFSWTVVTTLLKAPVPGDEGVYLIDDDS
jgi:hypothetical protein